MIRKVIAIAAPNDYGKSSVLKSLINRLPLVNKNILDMSYKPVKSVMDQDVFAHGEIVVDEVNKKIGIATFGDKPEAVSKNLEALKSENCDCIIVATHTGDYPKTGFYYTKEFAEKYAYKFFVTTPITEWSQEPKKLDYIDEINGICTKSLIELIKL